MEFKNKKKQTAVINVFLERKKDFTCTFCMLQQLVSPRSLFGLKRF